MQIFLILHLLDLIISILLKIKKIKHDDQTSIVDKIAVIESIILDMGGGKNGNKK